MKTLYTGAMTITAHEKAEWLRMAAKAEATGRTCVARAYRAAAKHTTLPYAQYDALQTGYRNWLLSDEYPGE